MKKFISWVVAGVLAVCLANGIAFFYERPVGYMLTPYGASKAIRRPYSVSVHGLEGYAITTFDKNGYANENLSLNDSYVLMMGSSHTHAQEVEPDKKYSALVNDMLSQENDDKLYTYNISCEGHFLPDIIKHFNAAIQEYPNSDCVTIEIGSTDYSLKQFQDAQIQVQFDGITAEKRFQNLGIKTKIKNIVKEYVPLISIIKNNIKTSGAKNLAEGEAPVDKKAYYDVVYDALQLMRSLYSGQIVVLYHPSTNIEMDGSISLGRSGTVDIFKDACIENKIVFIDLGNRFIEHYETYRELPYGFSNTTPGNGHLNEVGHKIMADAILDYLAEVNYK